MSLTTTIAVTILFRSIVDYFKKYMYFFFSLLYSIVLGL